LKPGTILTLIIAVLLIGYAIWRMMPVSAR